VQRFVNREHAVQANHSQLLIAGELKTASDDEKAAIRKALDELISEERAGPSGLPTRSEVLRFYEHFMEYIGIESV
jgi:hypothetical protein